MCSALALYGGCGYRLVRGGPVFGASVVAIEPFSEDGPVGLSADVAAALSGRLAAAGFSVTTSVGRADAFLSGRLSLATLPGATLSTVQLYNVDAIVLAELHGRDGVLLWRHECSVRESFLPPDPGTFPEPLTIEMRRRVALRRLAERAADSITEALELANVWQADDARQQERQAGARRGAAAAGD